MRESVRVYGPLEALGSFGSIVRGYVDGLTQAGSTPDVFQTVDMMDENEPDGACAAYGLGFGIPSVAYLMTRRGQHRWRGWMLAPNSSFVPENIFNWIEHGEAEIMTPSAWGADVIRALRPSARVHVVPHGVPATWRRLRPRAPRAPGGLRALHVTSTAGDRKGTWETARAFDRLARLGALGPKALLVIKADWLTAARLEDLKTEHVRVIDGLTGSTWEDFVRWFDFVVQPSRAEGFGLVPLEALALGVPVVATTCTGHGAYLTEESMNWAAVEKVPHGDEEPLFDDGEGAVAPALDEAEVEAAILRAANRIEQLREQAEASRIEWVNTWGYDLICGQFLDYLSTLTKGDDK